MKFKVGDRVRVTEAVTDHRQTEIGKIVTITDINGRGLSYYARKDVNYYDVNDSIFIFYEDELELAPFTKADLKDGMVVEYCDGDRRMVLGDKLIGYDSWVDIVAFNDNLECKNNKDLNIDKVYNSDSHILKDYFKDKSLTLIWERNKEEEESAKKMTVAEVEKELGYKVEIVSND